MLEVEKPQEELEGEVLKTPEVSVETEAEEPIRAEVIEILEKPVSGKWTAVFAKAAEIFRRFYQSVDRKN